MKITADTLSKKVALLGMMSAQAIALSWLEGLIPPLPVMPPGAKLGLSNIVTMFAAARMGLGNALLIAVLKAGFSGLTRGMTAGLMSLSGGVLSTAVVWLVFHFGQKQFGLAGIGVLGALSHNGGQFFVAWMLMGSKAIWGYVPFLILFAIGTGLLTGILLKVLLPVLDRQFQWAGKP